MEYKNINFTVWDVGGQDKIRPLWRCVVLLLCTVPPTRGQPVCAKAMVQGELVIHEALILLLCHASSITPEILAHCRCLHADPEL